MPSPTAIVDAEADADAETATQTQTQTQTDVAPVPTATAVRHTVVSAPTATPVPVSASNSTSGNAIAAAGQAQTTTDNVQLAVGAAAGGEGSLAVTNQHSSNVVDTSSASAQTGLSVALAPTVLPGTPAPAGITTASSGNASAIALQAQNNVSNTSAGIVQVGGANHSSIGLTSSSSVDVADTAASGALSGQAWAVAPGVDGSPVGVTMPGAVGAAPTSAAMSAAGLSTEANLSSTVTTSVTAAGGQAGAHAITIANSQTANAAAIGVANAASGAACAATCTTGSTAPAAPASAPVTQAASGSASAQGLTAQNTVNTVAEVAVRIAGQNFQPIKVVVESVTNIFNMGIAAATSGDATAGAGGGGSGGSSQTASSGSAQASGGQAKNTVNLGSSAKVHVTGDNYNPINIFLDLAANLVNWGSGTARSGDAQATGSGDGSAGSGAAYASGMQVMNLVNMWADASIDIDGNNYAPIFVHITFTTNIDNRGVARASSGNVAAGQSGTTGGGGSKSAATPTTASSSGQSTGGGVVGSASRAQSGNAFAVSNSVVANITSNQISSANGSKAITADAIAQMARNVAAGTWDPFVQQQLPLDSAPAVQNGLSTRSGDGTATGLESEVNISNDQLVVCKDPTVVCVARNLASLKVTAQDSKTNPAIQDGNGNPGPGGVEVVVSDALANATPTPTPTATPKPTAATSSARGSSGGNGGGGGGGRNRATSGGGTMLAAELPANGHFVVVDLWDQWPGRRLPPMPNPFDRRPTNTTVTASLDNWPGADELPLPELSADAAPAAERAPSALNRRAAAASQDLTAGEAEDDDAFPLMELAEVDPFGGPDLEALPMPGQVLPALAIAQLADNGSASAALVEPDEPGAAPVELGFAALLAAVGALAGLRRGRLLSVLLKARSMRPTWPTWPAGLGQSLRPRWPALLSRQTQRALAIVRLTLGLLRLW